MGHGGKFKEDKVSTGSIVNIYAAMGNLRDAVDKAEKAIDRIGQESNDPKAWEELNTEADRIRTRGQNLVYFIRGLIKSQEKA